MDRGKRASMREGPLAALFRKTAEDTEGAAPGEQALPAAEPEAAQPKAAQPKAAQPNAAQPNAGQAQTPHEAAITNSTHASGGAAPAPPRLTGLLHYLIGRSR